MSTPEHPSPTMQQFAREDRIREILDAHPGFRRKIEQFAVLYDAAQVITDLQAPEADVAAQYLREVADHVIRRDTALPEEFLQAMIAARPPLYSPPTV